MMILETKQLKRVYSKTSGRFTAVNGVGLQINKGDFISIIGKSGSGKSTLINMVVGLLRPTEGKVLLDGQDIWQLRENDLAYIRNSKLGYIQQGYSLLPNYTVLDNVRLPFFLAKRDGDGIKKARELLEKVGLKKFANRYPSELSGGEIRRVSIARSLINGPDLLVADEPTGDLDEETTQEIMQMFKEINHAGTSILMVTHEIDTTSYGNRLCKMSAGRLEELEANF